MVKRIQHIALILTLLLLGGMVNEAWATVTYHVISLPYDNPLTVATETYRIEALKVIDNEGITVSLPAAYKSELVDAGSWKYYVAGQFTTTANVKIHSPNTLGYTTYSDFGEPTLTEGQSLADAGTPTDIYVTYTYTPASHLNDDYILDGSRKYNVGISDTKGNNYFLAFNFTRNDRPAAVAKGSVSSSALISDEAVTISGSNYYFQWYFKGEDPYNVVLESAYEGSDTKKHDAQLFARYGYNMWLTKPSNKLSNKDMQQSLYTSFILLKREGNWVFMAANLVEMPVISNKDPDANGIANSPNAKGQYPYLAASTPANPKAEFMDEAVAKDIGVLPEIIDRYRYHVTTPSGVDVTAIGEWSSDNRNVAITEEHIPEDLKRKFCTYTGFRNNASPKASITTFQQAYDGDADKSDGYIDLWVDYSVSGLPFDTSTDYRTARWYTLSSKDNNHKLGWNATNSDFETASSNVETNHANQFAFIGDPYEMRVFNRALSESDGYNSYVGIASGSADNTPLSHSTTTPAGYVWEIMNDNRTGFVLREFKSAEPGATPHYINWQGTTPQTAKYSTSDKTNIVANALTQYTYTYRVVNNAGNIAVKCTASQDVTTPLNFSNIPEIIRSPFLALPGTTVKFYTTKPSNISDGGDISETVAGNSDIYIKYDVATSIRDNSPYKLNDTQTINVQLDGEYLYYSSGDIKTQVGIDNEQIDDDPYCWQLLGEDPYAMKIKNLEARNYVNVTATDNSALSFGAGGTEFIAKSSGQNGVYEVMIATGETINAASEYYNIGRPESNTVKIYSNSTYPHGRQQLRFVLNDITAGMITYHLIDKAGKDLLQVETRNTELVFPSEYQSPLVSQYHYYKLTDFTDPNTSATPISGNADAVYELNGSPTELTSTGENTDIYVTYEANSKVNFLQGNNRANTKMYLLKFANGVKFQQEDGSDGRRNDPDGRKAVYPYSNGDASLYVYGEEELLRQQGNAASTRTRWGWYAQSQNNDPYHVMIVSVQANQNTTDKTSTYPDGGNWNYLRTYKPVGYDYIVTGVITQLTQRNIDYLGRHIVDGESDGGLTARKAEATAEIDYLKTGNAIEAASVYQSLEYMILGTEGQYRLVTTQPITGKVLGEAESTTQRRTVISFEQYWKTYDTIKKKLLGVSTVDNTEDRETVPTTGDYRTTLTGTYGFHSYKAWANAKRWNGYNNLDVSYGTDYKAAKGYEYIEHWYETISMGDGSFDFVETSVDPVMVLLDNHGWEIMRKTIPSSPSLAAEKKAALYAAIRPYNSAMVKGYKFWHQATKATGYHKYTVYEPITLKSTGEQYISEDLTVLPPYDDANNLWELDSKTGLPKKANLMDMYITYEVKDEYATSYTGAATKAETDASAFLFQQGLSYATTTDGSTITRVSAPSPGGMSQLITQQGFTGDMSTESNENKRMLWYLKPNFDIDSEMGYIYAGEVGAQADAKSKAEMESNYFSNGQNGFDPYNIQIESAAYPGKYFTTNAVEAHLLNGAMESSYTGDESVSLTTLGTTVSGVSYDSRVMYVTNGTFMAVQDGNGNMRLMPRFDHGTRMTGHLLLREPHANAPVDDIGSGSAQTTLLVRPTTYEYIIVDNEGRESLRYKSGGDNYPHIPSHFQSPMAKDFKYYKELAIDGEHYVITGDAFEAKEITGSFAEAGLTNVGTANTVFVRYDYNHDYDYDNIRLLQGKWLTMKLAEKDVKYSSSIVTDTKPEDIDATQKSWQWKLLKNPRTEPDPYAVSLYNRNQKDLPMSTNILAGGTVTAQTEGADGYYQRFALLSHPSGGYAFAVAGTTNANCDTYYFLNGDAVTTSVGATTVQETDFKSITCSFDGIKSQLVFDDDVQHEYTYNVINNVGVKAVSETQSGSTALYNEFVPILPYEAQSPLLDEEDGYSYYDTAPEDPAGTYAVDDNSGIETLLGLYEDEVFVRYTYDEAKSPLSIPNQRNAVGTGGDDVAVSGSSVGSALNIKGEYGYNIIFMSDYMMGYDDTNSKLYDDPSSVQDKEITDNSHFLWYFSSSQKDGDNVIPDPYDLRLICKQDEAKWLGNDDLTSHKCNLGTETTGTDKAASFVLLKKSGYDFGILTVCGNQTYKLDSYDGSVTIGDDPTKFLIFSPSIQKIIYQLVIARQGGEGISIPARAGGGESVDNTTTISGTTLRDLTGYTFYTGDYSGSDVYHYEAGKVNLGAEPSLPESMKRQYCTYVYRIDHINDGTGSLNPTLTNKYKGLVMDRVWDDLINTQVYVNVVYTVDGLTFADNSSSATQWYTMETSGETPYVAAYTFKQDKLTAVEGRDNHYTNPYLWAPVGDPYGFYLHNRYKTVNGSSWSSVMTTSASPLADADLIMSTTPDYAVYEAIIANIEGYSKFRSVTNINCYITNTEGVVNLGPTGSRWKFQLSDEQLSPYRERVGYVGGLTDAAATSYDDAGTLAAKQAIVYNTTNIMPYTAGYWRLHTMPNVEGITTPRYLSGYTHQIELTAADKNAIPMHVYEREGVETTFEQLGGGFSNTAATRGDIPITDPLHDPASIFYLPSAGPTTLQTQGLYAKDEVMTAASGSATNYYIEDVGAAVLTLRNGSDRTTAKYLNYSQSDNVYNVKATAASADDKRGEMFENALWCLKPVKSSTPRTAEMALEIDTHDGGDGYYYSTFYVPFDVTITNADAEAYVCTAWNTDVIHPSSIGKSIPAGTPAIIRSTASGGIVMTLPGTALPSESCVFTGEYLEQKLSSGNNVFTFGLPYSAGTVSVNPSDGVVSTTAAASQNGCVGFYLNANPNRENSTLKSGWTRNNWYVLANKAYYRATGVSPAPQLEGVQFVPVIFGDEEPGEEELQPDGSVQVVGDGCIYDLLGRKVATQQQVEDGTWRERLAPGIYILNGKKFKK